jgi:dickkopf
MTALGVVGAARFLVALIAAVLCSHPGFEVNATLNSVLVNSNAIKNLPPPLGGAAGHPGSTVSVAPGILYEGGNKYQTLDHYQVRGVVGMQGLRDHV